MRILVLLLAFAATAAVAVSGGADSVYVAKWGIPSFEDEGTSAFLPFSSFLCPLIFFPILLSAPNTRWNCRYEALEATRPTLLHVSLHPRPCSSCFRSPRRVSLRPLSPFVSAFSCPLTACVLCQYAVQRVEHALLQRLDSIDRQSKSTPSAPSTVDPFANAAPTAAAVVPGFASSVADAANVRGAITNSATAMLDTTFDPSIGYKKELIRSLRTRWGGSSILRYIWEDFLTHFCSQDRIPGIYVPVCSMMYENARKIMKLIFYGFPNDQVCLMSKMCGKNSYFAAPTAVHDPVMSLYWNNKRGLSGFEGGIHGVTVSDLQSKRAEKEAMAKQAIELKKKRAEAARMRLESAEKRAELKAQRALEDAKRALETAEKAKHEAERRKYEAQVEKTRAELEARKRAEVEAREALAREANVRMTNLLPLSRLKMELSGHTLALVDASQTQSLASITDIQGAKTVDQTSQDATKDSQAAQGST